jgi:hypothetical protein
MHHELELLGALVVLLHQHLELALGLGERVVLVYLAGPVERDGRGIREAGAAARERRAEREAGHGCAAVGHVICSLVLACGPSGCDQS